MTVRNLVTCAATGRELSRLLVTDSATLHEKIKELIKKAYPSWNGEGFVDTNIVNKARETYLNNLFEEEQGQLTQLDTDVLENITQTEIITKNIEHELEQRSTPGERIADRVASFGGSWAFIISFVCILIVWIVINSVVLVHRYDPYPFILLNLILSCIAALQAPVIMMSQNRQEAKDRLRSQNDYKVNLKAELEIKLLHDKIDHLIMHQNMRLLEIQKIQIEMIEDLTHKLEKK